MKVVVTGSSGMLGTDLIKVLSPAFEVYGLSRHAAASPASHFKSVFLDLTDYAALRSKLLEIKPDYVIHAAAFTKVDLCEDPQWQAEAKKQNTEVVEELARICNETGSYLIFFSTDYVFSGQKPMPYLETDPVEPVNYYGQTKARAEEILLKQSKRFMIFRVTWLYGENGYHFPGAILKQVPEKKELSVVADQWGRPTWTNDIALALKDLLASRQNLTDRYNKRIFHIGNDGTVNWSGYARRILDQTGHASVRIKEITTAELNRPAPRPANSVLDLTQAETCLGIRMRPWQEAVDEFLRLRNH